VWTNTIYRKNKNKERLESIMKITHFIFSAGQEISTAPNLSASSVGRSCLMLPWYNASGHTAVADRNRMTVIKVFHEQS